MTKKTHPLKLIIRIIEYFLGILLVLLLLSKASDYFFWTAYYDSLTKLPFVVTLFDLDDGYEDVNFEDVYYKQVLGVIDQIAKPEHIENIVVKQDWENQKLFKITLVDNTKENVLVLFTGGEYKVSIARR